jgi:hypothetical protein
MSETEKTAPNSVVPARIRYSALAFSCLLTFGGYLVFDLCSTLQVLLSSKTIRKAVKRSYHFLKLFFLTCLG